MIYPIMGNMEQAMVDMIIERAAALRLGDVTPLEPIGAGEANWNLRYAGALKTQLRQLREWFDGIWPDQVDFDGAFLDPLGCYSVEEFAMLELAPDRFPQTRVVARSWAKGVYVPREMAEDHGRHVIMDASIRALCDEVRQNFSHLARVAPGRKFYWRRRPQIETCEDEAAYWTNCVAIKMFFRWGMESDDIGDAMVGGHLGWHAIERMTLRYDDATKTLVLLT